MNKKEESIFLRISSKEKDTILQKASHLNVGISEYLRLCALNKNVQPLVNKDLITSINRIGANINQILRVLNSNSKAISVYGNLPAEIEQLKNLMIEVKEIAKENIRNKQ